MKTKIVNTKLGVRTEKTKYRWEWSSGSFLKEYRYTEESHDMKWQGGGGGTITLFCLWGFLKHWRRGY